MGGNKQLLDDFYFPVFQSVFHCDHCQEKTWDMTNTKVDWKPPEDTWSLNKCLHDFSTGKIPEYCRQIFQPSKQIQMGGEMQERLIWKWILNIITIS